MNWLDDLTIDDLPERYKEMAEMIGVDNTLKLAEKYPKQGFYFIGLQKVIIEKKADYIRKHFNGANHKDLARATGYSERWVYEILKGCKDERQVELFGDC